MSLEMGKMEAKVSGRVRSKSGSWEESKKIKDFVCFFFLKKKLTKNTWETSDVADLEKYWTKG